METHGGRLNEVLQTDSEHMLAAKITNEKTGRRIGNNKDVAQLIMEGKFTLFGHICRMGENRVSKNVVFETIEGRNQRERNFKYHMDSENG